MKLVPILLGDPGAQEKDRWHEFLWVDEHGKTVLKKGRIIGGMYFSIQDDEGHIVDGNLDVVLSVPGDNKDGTDGLYGYGPGGIIKKSTPPEA